MIDASGLADTWQTLFGSWPEQLPRSGWLVTTWGETISFVDFRLGAGVLLVERDRPDALGSRKVLVPYGHIAGLKLASTATLSAFDGWRFR
ncbi:MAG: hypothetical protein D6725_14955 [Planctomycetota bacterium]|nr:MAG: hypothetical protein D6725_14955 [Planctomycetota bacterium]